MTHDQAEPGPPTDPGRLAQALGEHLASSKETRGQFSTRSGVSEATISRLLAGSIPLRRRSVQGVWEALPHSLRAKYAAAKASEPRIRTAGKRHFRVFVSSTYLDLEARRSLVIGAIDAFENLKADPMERWGASSDSAVASSLRRVRECDLYIGILAYRYGWIPSGEQKSITELEHDAAFEAGLDRLVFVIDERKHTCNIEADMDPLPGRFDLQSKLQAFKSRLASSGIGPRPFGSDAELVQLVNQSLRDWLKTQGRIESVPVPKLDSGYTEMARYRDALLAEHRYLRLAGMPTTFRVEMLLDDLFIPQRAAFREQRERDRRPLQVQSEGSDGGSDALPFAVPLGSVDSNSGVQAATVFSQAHDLGKNVIVVTGVAGSGKTTQLRRLTKAALMEDASRLLGLAPTAGPSQRESWIPVFVPLKVLTKALLDEGTEAVLHACLPAHAKLDLSFARRIAKSKRRLLLFDGMDELPSDDLRKAVARWALELAQDGTSWVVLSARPAGYSSELQQLLGQKALHVELAGFDELQRDDFIRRWYRQHEAALQPEGWSERAERNSSDLIRRLKEPKVSSLRVMEMTSNPLLLTVICLIHRDKGSYLPDARARLYLEASETLLEGWRRSAGLHVEISAEDARPVLEALAHHLHFRRLQGGSQAELEPVLEGPLSLAGWGKSTGEFLRFLRDDSGIFSGDGQGGYRFLHLGFQEYFAACWLRGELAQRAANLEDRGEFTNLLDEVVGHYGDAWWQEVLLLLLGLPTKPHLFEPCFERLLTLHPGRVALTETTELMALCLREARGVTFKPFQRFLKHELIPGRAERQPMTFTLAAAITTAVRLASRLEGGRNALLEPTMASAMMRSAPLESAELVLGLALELPEATRELLLGLLGQLKARQKGPELGAVLERLEARLERRFPGALSTSMSSEPALASTEGTSVKGIDFVPVPGGEFRMGDEEYSDSQPIRTVKVAPFFLARHPVTNAQYGRFVEEMQHEAPEYWKRREFNGPDQPVVGVSWADAQAFCKWAGLRLPSEAEWEYACRAGTTTAYWFGDDEGELLKYAWIEGNSGGAPRPVCQKPANPWGLYDMHGNVWEWCQDEWHGSYRDAPLDGSPWESKKGAGNRVIRGGSWRGGARWCRSAFRRAWHPGSRYGILGFRPALDTTL